MEIIPLNAAYISQVKDLCDRSVGEGFYTLDDWAAIADTPGKFCNLLVAGDGVLIGYNYNHLVSEAEAAAELKLPAVELRQVSGAEAGAVYGICKSMGIEPDRRVHGLGYRLLRRGVDQLFAAGACSLWGSAWKQGDHIPMRGIFDQLEFSYLRDAQRVWYDVEGLKCPACKQPRCICEAAYFYKNREVAVP